MVDAWSVKRSSLAVFAAGASALLIPALLGAATLSAPTLRAALETMMTLFAFAAAWLFRSHFLCSRSFRDLLLLSASLVLGLLNFLNGALPAAFDLHAGVPFAASGISGQLFVACALAGAAHVPGDRIVARSRNPLVIAAAMSAGAVVLAEVGGLLLSQPLVGRTLYSEGTVFGGVHNPLALLVVLATTGLFMYAAAGFARWRGSEPGLGPALACVAGVLAVASSYYLVRRALAPGQVSASEGLRLIASGLILAGAICQERVVRSRMAKAAALAERRRVASDLHDGLAQDLALIAAHSSLIGQQMGEEHPVATAARRALTISRQTISELSDPASATAHESLQLVAHELRDRFGVSIAVSVALDNETSAEERGQVSRIAREAIANAARHGGAKNIAVSLRRTDGGLSLRVIDDGCGVDEQAAGATAGGFGLANMRDRAAALGGLLTLRSGDVGTELEVLLP